jgi:hypothetical protein
LGKRDPEIRYHLYNVLERDMDKDNLIAGAGVKPSARTFGCRIGDVI